MPVRCFDVSWRLIPGPDLPALLHLFVILLGDWYVLLVA